MHNISRQELDDIIEQAVEQAVEKSLESAIPRILERLGIDSSDPLEVQSDFKFMRNMRRGYETSLFKAFGALVTAATLGIAFMIWDSIKK